MNKCCVGKRDPNGKNCSKMSKTKGFSSALYAFSSVFFCAIEMQHSVCSSRFLDLSGILQNVKKGL